MKEPHVDVSSTLFLPRYNSALNFFSYSFVAVLPCSNSIEKRLDFCLELLCNSRIHGSAASIIVIIEFSVL